MGKIPTLEASTEMMRRHWDVETYPRLVYVETTNYCNAHCTFCLYDRMERPVETMSVDTFKRIAEKVKERGLKIGAMFCFGEPLADKTLFKKIRAGRAIGVMTDYLGFNTNVSLLTEDKYHDIVTTCSNMTLSFPNTHKAFEDLTGLSWDECYRNALAFIDYRDQHAPQFQIEIGVNDVTGHDRAGVHNVFMGKRVDWARDAEIQWGGKTITGVIDRSIMYRQWACDGYDGYMQVKPNGDCCFCAYDVVRNETRFSNILRDSWPVIESSFKELWRQPASLCLRCDFWWNYKQMIAGGWRRGDHIDSTWREAYDDQMPEFWDKQQELNNVRYLTGSELTQIEQYLKLSGRIRVASDVLNIGVGTGRCTRELLNKVTRVSALDISRRAIARVASQIENSYTDAVDLPSDTFDLAICFLVIQHIPDVDLYPLLRHAIRSLKPDGAIALQFASPPDKLTHIYSETRAEQIAGTVQRTCDHVLRIVTNCGGIVTEFVPTVKWDPETSTDANVWNGVIIQRASQ